MKKIPLAIISLAILTLILGGCPDVLSGKPDLNRPAPGTENIPNGFGALRVNVTLGNARTALPAVPNPEVLSIHYFFTKLKNEAGETITPPQEKEYTDPVVDKTLILEPGVYRLKIEARIQNDIVAEGLADDDITINNGRTTSAAVNLQPIVEDGEGTLSFKITYTGTGASVTACTLTDLPEQSSPNNLYTQLDWTDLSKSHTVPNIHAGYYLLQITLEKNAAPGSLPPYASKSRVVHIYKNQTTETEYEFFDTDFITDLLVTSAADDGPGSLRDTLKNAGNGKIIRIKLPPLSKIELESSLVIDKDITIVAEANAVTITRYIDDEIPWDAPVRGFTGSFFIIGEDTKSGTLTLGGKGSANITLDGRKVNTSAKAALITINKGALFMNEGVTLKNNRNSSYSDSDSGGGVLVNGNDSTFTMNGGTISGNNAYNGGGVSVNGGTFTMNKGTIGGDKTDDRNDSEDGGGGVYVNGGTFTMTSNDAKILKNNAEGGGGVFVSANSTFIMDGGIVSRNSGSGVYVYGSNSQFTMNSGTISGNSGGFSGGGVCVRNSGTFNMTGGTIGGDETGDANTAQKGGGVNVSGGTFTMSKNATISGNRTSGEDSKGGGVYVNGGSFTMEESATVSGNETTISFGNNGGGGVYVYGSSFTMKDNATVSGNRAILSETSYPATTFAYGGGVYITGTGSEFNMFGGTISGNTADNNGGGVYVSGIGKNDTSIFYMNSNTTISGNNATNGGGVYVAQYGELSMSGGAISGNIATNPTYGGGGGVYISQGFFGMSGDARIHGNYAYVSNGGGGGVSVCNSGNFTMNGNAEVSGNHAILTPGTAASLSANGGGVYAADGSFTMNSGKIFGNEADGKTVIGRGGGVFVQGVVPFTMSGGKIFNNEAKGTPSTGGGVCVYDGGVFRITDGTVYGKNEDTNSNKATTGAALSLETDAGVATGTAQYGTLKDAGTLVFTPNGDLETTNDTIKVVNGVLEVPPVAVSSSTDWDNALNQIQTGGDYKSYIINVTSASPLSVSPSDFGFTKNISVTITGGGTLELNTKGNLFYIEDEKTLILENITLRGRSDNDAPLVWVGLGTLIMKDGSTITGNTNGDNGGGVYVANAGSTFTMNGGTISGNGAYCGGGVYVEDGGTFTMTGSATVSGNTVTGYGGGVYVNDSEFTMSGGTISGNTVDGTSANSGGGVFVQYGEFTMTGGTISGNEAPCGGGVGISSIRSTFTMQGSAALICGNGAFLGGGVYIDGDGTFHITDGIIRGTGDTNPNTVYDGGEGAALWSLDDFDNAQYGTGSSWTNFVGTTSSVLGSPSYYIDSTIQVVGGSKISPQE